MDEPTDESRVTRRPILFGMGMSIAGILSNLSAVRTASQSMENGQNTATEATTVVVDQDPDVGLYSTIGDAVDDLDWLSGETGDVVIQVNEGEYTLPEGLFIEDMYTYSVRLEAVGDVQLTLDSDADESTLFSIDNVDFGLERPVEDPDAVPFSITIRGFDFVLDDSVSGISVGSNAESIIIEDNIFKGSTQSQPVVLNSESHTLSLSNNEFIDQNLVVTSRGVVWIDQIDGNNFSVSGNRDVVYLVTTNVQQMSNNQLTGGRHGVNLFESVVDTLESNTIEDGANVGVWVYASTVWEFVNNEIQSYREGVHVSAVSGVDTMTQNTITNHDAEGLHVSNGVIRMAAENSISRNECGILLEGRDDGLVTRIDELESNQIHANEAAGIWCDHNTYIEQAQHNELYHNTESIVFESVSDTTAPTDFDQTTLTANALGTTQETGVRIHDAYHWDGQLDALDNWWGDASGPAGGVEDPETGATATGKGSDIVVETEVEPVRFDPHLSERPDEVDAEPDEATLNAVFSYDPSNPTVGETVSFDAGESETSDGIITNYEWDFTDDGTVDAIGETTTYTYGHAGEYDVILTVTNEEGETDIATETVTVGSSSAPGDLTGNGNPPTDTTGDGLLNDVNGDGEFDITDVQVFFENLENNAIQNNPELFDFSQTGGDVTITDVQALFEQL